ncbi:MULTISPECIES: 23S rRNA (adenine(2030)-N(6))-methyltransferase RlmJ [unclassified Herbaspirillum]|jgi:23S rRNA (adenine2030-N6)-methyltransferase|uniref:23S rRNA (adenine(2030)-N(6))-methyltransferase RlmJ n=1 Tax=unclassified Herbaspirillum TaxID=2624150 RepID=UPI000E2FD0A3|nr:MULTISPECIES: 23S rRNA (adenine(2030)-N(6))-methyltransferase RlmJ [unclassified Herbaspirillum]RFB73416.1 23S rRNA (adenine(2030)-N(6))-methyltransferase RlmJ [Herbaspirillum sp. 3R-3a1]TFI10777.1 23S rRNA (adenine(2030)-N(6))-methyltransferase RlmJ [Herbaspirillum sp. 3R11]TFI16684.1 23S rRNA (adenine(2030)-N(6))-methyltransferase RlmJ [Herbaspirillum sp. 3R-11]TFI31672.1 23S rRNA (adenine(2030)-N(6))-methyltransferase RlmJ [Herbaspirillum sp. 3C11]
MLSYRHAFHAGNHADVLKHMVTIQLMRYLGQKDTPYMVVDTHAGGGVYALDGNYASKNAEYETGIGPLWDRTDLPEAVAEYVQLVKDLNPSGKMRYYPGSPYCANQVMREQDRLRLFELHTTESKILADNFRKLDAHAAEQGKRPSARGKRVMIERGDGFLALKALLPPPSRRALVLIDPPYEDKRDYQKVKEALQDALVRFPTGTYAVWYPVLQRIESKQFSDRLKRLGAKSWINVTLSISSPSPDGFGLHTSGMFVLNPPWTLLATLKEVMPYLVKVLGRDSGAGFLLESGEA